MSITELIVRTLKRLLDLLQTKVKKSTTKQAYTLIAAMQARSHSNVIVAIQPTRDDKIIATISIFLIVTFLSQGFFILLISLMNPLLDQSSFFPVSVLFASPHQAGGALSHHTSSCALATNKLEKKAGGCF